MALEHTNYFIHVRGVRRPVLASLSNKGACRLLVRLSEVENHTLGDFRGIGDALAMLEAEHQRNPRRMLRA
jgi:hypothetical protein